MASPRNFLPNLTGVCYVMLNTLSIFLYLSLISLIEWLVSMLLITQFSIFQPWYQPVFCGNIKRFFKLGNGFPKLLNRCQTQGLLRHFTWGIQYREAGPICQDIPGNLFRLWSWLAVLGYSNRGELLWYADTRKWKEIIFEQ